MLPDVTIKGKQENELQEANIHLLKWKFCFVVEMYRPLIST